MEQHRVPQDIATYQFRLVGDMTLKQFAELAAGALTAFLFYSIPLPIYLKFPAILISVFFGVGLAFMPIEEQPLDRWIINFLKAIYSPTQYFWQKKPRGPQFLQKTTTFLPRPQEKLIAAADKRRLREYLATLPSKQKTTVDEEEATARAKINQLFQKNGLKRASSISQTSSQVLEIKVEPGVRIRKLGDSLAGGVVFSKPRTATPLPTQKGTISREPKINFKPLVSPEPVNYQPPPQLKPVPSKKATFAQKIPEPLKAEAANILTGLVLTDERKFIPEAIVSVIDENELPVRALKTNVLGQFFSATPLKKGCYQIEVEKEGYDFDIITLEVEDKIIPPVEIKAKPIKKPEGETTKILEF